MRRAAVASLLIGGGVSMRGVSVAACEGDPDTSVLGAGCTPIPVEPTASPADAIVRPAIDADGRSSACNYTYDFTYDPAAPDADVSINMSGRRQHLYLLAPGSSDECFAHQWIDAADPTAAPAVTAADLLPGVWVNVQRQLPTPIPRVAPADFNPKGYTYVQNPTFFWVDQTAGHGPPSRAAPPAAGSPCRSAPTRCA